MLATPFGSWTVALAGVVVIAVGIYQCWRGYHRNFERKLDLAELGGTARLWIVRTCSFGIAARGAVFCVAGIFLVQAGLQSDASKARGLSGSLGALQSQPFGHYLFGLVAVGLAAFGIYCCMRARYERISQR